MANFDYRVDENDSQLSIKVATFAHGNINLVLNKTEMSQQEEDDLNDQLSSQGVSEQTALEIVTNEIMSRVQHSQIVQSINQNGIDEVINLVGTDPSGWYVTYCSNHGIAI